MIKEAFKVIEGKDFSKESALEFETVMLRILQRIGHVFRQVRVSDRGDGRSGRIDFVVLVNGEKVPIEVDRKSARQKSIFKVRLYNPKHCYVITRSPLKVIDVSK